MWRTAGVVVIVGICIRGEMKGRSKYDVRNGGGRRSHQYIAPKAPELDEVD